MRELQRRGVRLGILTRNDHQLALITLEAIGLGGCFPTEHILGRGEARPSRTLMACCASPDAGT